LRLGASGLAMLVLELAWPVARLDAQGTGGKLEGRVHDSSGAPLARAQVQIDGTAFGAVTSDKGYYFINNVPSGVVTLKARMIGYRPVEVTGLRILADQTVSQDFVLDPQAVELDPITVVAQDLSLVPRDLVTTRQRVDGEFTEALPVDRLAQALALTPGVIIGSRRGSMTLTIRGGRPDEAAVYVDGVPVTPGFKGTYEGGGSTPAGQYANRPHGLDPPVGAVEEASVTAGALAADVGNAQSGVISIETRNGGTTYHGSVSFETDEPFGVNHSIGFNRIQASIGGPIKGRLGFYVSGALEGRKSVQEGMGAARSPLFVLAGVDTTVTVPTVSGDPTGSDSTRVDVARFAVGRGSCNTFSRSRNRGIATNYGLDCQGIRTPWSGSTTAQLSTKLSYSYGQGSRLSLGYVGNQNQGRAFQFPNVFASQYERLYVPELLDGHRDRSQALTLHWTHNLARSAERALGIDLAVSRQSDQSVAGPFTRASELRSRNPFGGFLLGSLGFRVDFDNFPVDNRLIRSIRDNDRSRMFPYDVDNADQYLPIDRYRNNAYGLQGFADGGGPFSTIRLTEETRWVVRGGLDWQVDRYNRARVGTETTFYRTGDYRAIPGAGGLALGYLERPVVAAGYVEDRLDLGDLVLVGGVRYDWFDARASRPPRTPPSDSIPKAEYDARTTPQVRYRSHQYLSPRVQVGFPITTSTAFRLSYAHQVQVPDFVFLFDDNFVTHHPAIPTPGSDLSFARTIAYEFGFRHAFSPDFVIDLSAFHKNQLSDAAQRLVRLYDPSLGAPANFGIWTNADYGYVRGLDLRIDRRFGTTFNGMLAYSYQQAENTGADPFTYFDVQSLALATLLGSEITPPQSILPTGDSRPHSLTSAFAMQSPAGWRHGSLIARILSDMGLFATFRLASGVPYTRCRNTGTNQNVLSGGGCGQSAFAGRFNGARLPMQKQFDIRLTRDFSVGPVNLTAYTDVRNLFNFRNVVRVFTVNGTTRNGTNQAIAWSADSSGYASEALVSGYYGADGSIDLSFGGAADPRVGCGAWYDQAGQLTPPNCIYLIRAEERFGNGDHIFTVAEQRRASGAYYQSAFGQQRFLGPGRWARLGLEVSF
jgi:carboxypeptidase family protein/TonB-dependent receptor-like protein